MYDIDIYLTATSISPSSLSCPFTVTALQYLTFDNLMNGNRGPAMESAFQQALSQAGLSGLNGAASGVIGGAAVGASVASAGTAALVAAAALVVKEAILGIGVGVADAANSHLRDQLSANLQIIIPGPLNPTSVPALNDLNGFLSQGCYAMWGLGFTQFDADESGGSLNITLTHPVDSKAPVMVNQTAVAAKNLFQPQLIGSAPQVQAGQQFTITGKNFVSTQTVLSWNNLNAPSSGPIVESDILYGPKGSTNPPTTVTLKNPGQGGYSPQGLVAGSYEFQVRNCDILTCTPYSAPLEVAVAPQGSSSVSLYLDSVGAENSLGTTAIDAAGNFSVPVTIRAGTAAGTHNIVSVLGAASSGTRNIISRIGSPAVRPTTTSGPTLSILVTSAGQSLRPIIQVQDPTTHAIVMNITQTYNFVLQGSGFGIGQVVISFAKSGVPLGTATVGNNGTFSVQLSAPITVFGNQSLTATETINGQLATATVPVFVQNLPQ